jgi:hypothetical protein
MAFLIPDNTISMGGVLVNYYPLTEHNPKRIAMPGKMTKSIIGVTIHNTDAIKAASGTTMAEQYTRATVNGNMNSVRVHYYVDSVCAWQNLPLTQQGWHAADGNGNGNTRTIAIECIMSGKGTAEDKAAEDNAARIAADLLKTYGLGIDCLFTHTHWLNVRDGRKGTVDQLNVMRHPYKMCPLYILPHWQDFKAKVAAYMGEATKPAESEQVQEFEPVQFLVKIVDDDLNIRSGAGTEFPVVGKVYKGYVFTIVETARAKDGGTWGRLKSGAGWINIGDGYCRRV